MAIAAKATTNPGYGAGTERLVNVTSAQGEWVVLCTDARTAQSAADLLNPTAIDDATNRWVATGMKRGKLAALRARIPVATTAVATSPIVRVIGGWGTITTGAPPTDGTFICARLDASAWTTAGITLTFAASPDVATDTPSDGTYMYADYYFDTPLDLLGADFIIAAVSTAGAITASAAIEIMGLFVN